MIKNLLIKLVSKTEIYRNLLDKFNVQNNRILNIIKTIKKIRKLLNTVEQTKEIKENKKLCTQIIKGV